MTTDQTTRHAPRRMTLDREEAMRLAVDEYDRVVLTLERLTPEQWTAPTECLGWDVRAMAGHMLGMAQMAASIPEMARQQLASKKRQKRDGGLVLDALTAVQVEKNAALSTAELVDRMRTIGPRAARARRRTPGFVRNRAVPDAQQVGDHEEVWTFGYLLDLILTRDPFLHRVDISRATGDPMLVTPDHEGVLVGDVVNEWAGRHGRPYSLELTGPAGGQWQRGSGGETFSMDALDFCRTLSGRAPGSGLLAVQVPF